MMGAKKSKLLPGLQFLTSGFSTMMVLLLLGMVVFFVLSAHNISVYVRENLTFSILLSDNASETKILQLKKELDSQPYVKESVYISKEQALKEETEAMGTDPTEFLGYNPFTASIEVKLNADYANVDSIAKIEKQLGENSNINDILYQKDLIDSVNRNISKISIVLIAIAALLTFISFALINNTIRLSIYSKRFLINTMKLVGASWGFIRAPFVRKHVLSGIVAAIFADIILACGAYMLMQYEPQLSEVITYEVMGIVMASVVFFGIVITFLCSFFSINGFLKMNSNELYNI